jgi:hypothetical protein
VEVPVWRPPVSAHTQDLAGWGRDGHAGMMGMTMGAAAEREARAGRRPREVRLEDFYFLGGLAGADGGEAAGHEPRARASKGWDPWPAWCCRCQRTSESVDLS